MTKKTLWALVGLLLMFSISCMFVEDVLNPTATPPAMPAATATRPVATAAPTATSSEKATPQPPAAEGDSFVLTIDNQTPYDICYVYISPTDSDSWGEDWLTSEGNILAGVAKAFNVPYGTYDILVEDCDHTTLGTAWEIDATTKVTFGGKGKAALRMTNDSDTEICFVYISPSPNNLGDDWLGDLESILSGNERIFFVDPGTYAITVEDCDHNQIYTEDSVSISGETQWVIPGTVSAQATPKPPAQGGGDFQVTVHNKTPDDICYVYISPADSDSWGDDWLGEDTLASGDSRTFDVTAGTYDMKVENCDDVTLATAWEFSSTVTLSPGEKGNTPVTVINHTGEKICYLFISPVSNDTWGEDLLGSLEVIPVDGGRRLFYVQPGKYDLLAEDCDENDIAELDSVDIQSAYTWDITK